MSVTLEQGAIDAVTSEIAEQVRNIHEEIMLALNYAGQEAVNKARNIVTQGGGGGVLPPYTVQTGNLVSSVGYAIVYNGQVISQSSFEAVKGTPDKNGIPQGDGREGQQTGQAYVKRLAMNYPQGYALILVAGMEYASYVQELHHRDVLVSGTLVAEQLVNELLPKLTKK